MLIMLTYNFMNDKYIGPNKILGITPIDLKTANDGDVVEVLFENGKKQIFTAKTLGVVVTNEPSDHTSVSNAKLQAMVADMLKIVEDYDVSYLEISSLGTRLGTAINENMNRARSFLWFGNDSDFVAGVDSENEVSLLMAKRVIFNGVKNNGKES